MTDTEPVNRPMIENKLFAYSLLFCTIVFQVLATGLLADSQQFTRLWPSVLAIFYSCLSYYIFSWSTITVPIGLGYGIWSALGTVLIMLMGVLKWQQVPDIPAMIGNGLIIAGVIIANCFSTMDA